MAGDSENSGNEMNNKRTMLQGKTKDIQGGVTKQVADEWEDATQNPKAQKQEVITALARLYYLMEPEMRGMVTLLLHDDTMARASEALLREVDKIITQRIASRLPAVERLVQGVPTPGQQPEQAKPQSKPSKRRRREARGQ